MKTKPFNVGDRVTDLRDGRGVVTSIAKAGLYPITVKFYKEEITYTAEGKFSTSNYMPTLIHGWYDSISIIGRNKKVKDGSKAADNK